MAESNGFKIAMRRVSNFFNNVVRQIKKGDKRFIIMAAAALVLVLILLILIIHGVSAGKKTKEPNTAAPSVVPEATTEDPLPLPAVNPDKTGKYKVNTSSESPLNMRLAADRTSDKIGSIPHDTVIEVLFVDESSVTTPGGYGWGYVEYNGKRGWVSMEYLVPATNS